MADRNKKIKRSVLTRNDPEFVKKMKEIGKLRFINNLEKDMPSTSEMTRLSMRTNAWKQLELELKKKKRRENL